MSALPLVMGLLLLAYLASFVVGGKGSFATSSNVGWIVLGFVLGPYAFNVVGETLLEAVTPVVTIAAGWVAFATGVRVFGAAEPVSVRPSVLGIATGLVTALAASGVSWLTLPLVFPAFAADAGQRLAFAVTVGAVASGSWRDRPDHATTTPSTLSTSLRRVARAEVLVPVLLSQVALAFAARPTTGLVVLPLAASFAAGLLLGPLLGVLTVPLFGREFGLREGWGALLGMAALAVGLSVRFGVSVVWVLFSLGATLVRFSHHREDIRAIVAPTERSLLLPLLVVLGARLDFGGPLVLVGAALVLLSIRALVRVVVLSPLPDNEAARAGASFAPGLFGLAALPITPLTLVVAASASLRFSHGPGALLPPLAVALALLGEIVSPLAFRALQKRAPNSVSVPAPALETAPPPARESSPAAPKGREERENDEESERPS